MVECSKCKDVGYIYTETTVVECSCRIEKEKRQLLGRFWNIELDKIKPIHPLQQKALEIIKADPSGSFYIWGEVGSGKTMFMSAIYNAQTPRKQKMSLWIRDVDLKKRMREDEINKETTSYIYEDFKEGRYKALFWDDVGKGIATDFVLQEIYSLMDIIYLYEYRLVLTTILSPKDCLNIYGGSIMRRIEDVVDSVIKLERG